MGLRARAWLVVAGGVGCGAGLLGLLWWRRQRLRSRQRSGYDALVGGTPMVELRQLSRLLKRRILCKAEFMNPGGTAKDRIAQSMLDAAEACGALREGGTVVEGTSGSTGIALAAQCRARGYRCVICMPEKISRVSNSNNVLLTFMINRNEWKRLMIKEPLKISNRLF